MMRSRRSRPFSLTHTSRPHSSRLRTTIAEHRKLAAAADAWHRDEVVSGHFATTHMAHDVRETTADARADANWQSYLNSAVPGTASGHAMISPFGLAQDIEHTELTADRAAASVHQEVGPVGLGATAHWFGTGLSAGGTVGPHDAHNHLEGFAIAGRSTKVVGADAAVHGAFVGAAIALVAENKIHILGPALVGDDGVSRRLARFTSKALPVLDINVARAAEHAGFGVRALFSGGSMTIYEKMVPVDELASLMRQRDRWHRNIIETLAAVGLVRSVRPPARTTLSRDVGRIDAMLPGESATWQSQRALLFGLAGGAYGVRGTGAFHLTGTSLYRIDRLAGDHAVLTVRPTRVTGWRLGAEVRVLLDLAGEYITSAASQHAWRFDLATASGRAALSAALAGQMPGALLPAFLADAASTLSAMAALARSSLPLGVTLEGASHLRSRELALSLTSIRLPDILGGTSLGSSGSLIASQSVTVHGNLGSVTQSFARQSSLGLLSLGSLSHASTASLTSSLSLSDDGPSHPSEGQLTLRVSEETSGSGWLRRMLLPRRLQVSLGRRPALLHAAPSRRYAVEVTQRLGLGDFARLGEISNLQLSVLAVRHSLPQPKLAAVRDVARQAAQCSSDQGYVDALASLAKLGRSGARALLVLSGKKDVNLRVDNQSHDQLLVDFFKAETYALGAKNQRHARTVLRRLERLDGHIQRAMKELGGDAVVAQMRGDEVRRRMHFLDALQIEALHLAADVSEQITD